MKNKFAKIFLGSLILITILFVSVLVSAANVDWQGNQSGRGIYWVKNTSGICFNDTSCFSSASGISTSNLNRSFADTLYYNISNPERFVNISTINGLFNYSAVISGVQTNVSTYTVMIAGIQTNVSGNTLLIASLITNSSLTGSIIIGIQGNVSNISGLVNSLITNNTFVNSVIVGLQGNISNSSTLISQIITNITSLNSLISGLQSNDTKFNTSIAGLISSNQTLFVMVTGTQTNVSNLASANNTVFTLIGQMQTNISSGLIASARLTGFATECSNGSAVTWGNVSSATCKVFLRAGDNFTGTLNGSFSGLFTGTVPYDSAAAGWTNTSFSTNTSFNVTMSGSVNTVNGLLDVQNLTIRSQLNLSQQNFTIFAYDSILLNFTDLNNTARKGINMTGYNATNLCLDIINYGNLSASNIGGFASLCSGVTGQTSLTLGANVIQPASQFWKFQDGSSFGFLIERLSDGIDRFLVDINGTHSNNNTYITGSLNVTGNIELSLGSTINLTRGTNACVGNVTVVSGASGFINTTCATGDYKVFITEIIAGGTPGVAYVTKGSANFTITGIATDSSTYDWFIVRII